MLQKATVNGLTADFFKTKDFNLLVWADTEGNLFKLRGNLDQASLEQIANSVKEVGKDMLPKYDMKQQDKSKQCLWIGERNLERCG